MQLSSVMGNSQRLDGGAMFGNAPRALWSRWCKPDEQNRIDLACRALLVEDEFQGQTRRVLLEAGIGAFFPPKLKERFGVVEKEHVLLHSLAQLGLNPEDIDVIVLSHLHFDHAGGLLAAFEEGQEHRLVFPNAHYVVGQSAWERAQEPHPRDRASFIPDLPALLQQSGRLEIVAGSQSAHLGSDYSFELSDGHTPGQLLTTVKSERGPVTFMGDLVPGTAWMHVPITMGYDRYPELVIDEKQKVLTRIEEQGGWAYFTHDPKVAAAKVGRDEKGRFVPQNSAESWQRVS